MSEKDFLRKESYFIGRETAGPADPLTKDFKRPPF